MSDKTIDRLTKRAEHTPIPWKIVSDAQGSIGLMDPEKVGVAVAWFSSTFSPANGYVGEKECELGRPQREANIQFIMRAVNAHEALLELGHMIDNWDAVFGAVEIIKKARLILAKLAEEKTP